MPHSIRHAVQKNDAWSARLATAVDLGIASTVLLAPLFMGGRGPVGRLVLILCIALTATAWCVRQCLAEKASWHKSGAEWLILAGLGLLVLQLTPLPQTILALLSPHVADLLPLWTTTSGSSLQLGEWNQLSLHPMATQSGLATYIAYATLFLVTYQRLRETEDAKRLLRLIAVATGWLAVVSLAQFLFSNGKFLWIFEHVSRNTNDVVKGPFQNQNHLAHLLALGIGPLLWWISMLQGDHNRRRSNRSRDRWRDPTVQSQILWVALGTVTFAALLTFSRGGVIATLLAAASGVALLSWKRMLSKRAISIVAVIAGLMVVSLSIHGYEPLARRLATLNGSQPIEELASGRWELWHAHARAIPDFWLLGTGVGTHRDIYPTYLTEHFNVDFTHGESGYMQLVLETGILGAGLFLVGVCVAFRWTLVPYLRETNREHIAIAAAIIPGLVASVVHSLGDFVWYIPACMTTTVLLLATGCYVYQASVSQSDESQSPSKARSAGYAPRLAWIGASITCLLVFASLANTLLASALASPHWYEYRRLSRATGANSRQPANSEDLAVLVKHVEATVAANPSDARANAQLADLYLQQFEIAQQHSQNPMPLSQIRDAALASRFASKGKLDDWLNVAVGKNRSLFDLALQHARRSVTLCPLEGEAYALLARVAFLEGPDANRKHEYVEQALQVRPFDSRVQFVAGHEAMLARNVEEALAHWKMAFHGELAVQNTLVRQLTAKIPANDLLVALAPEERGLDALLNHYKQIGEADSAKTIAVHYTHYLVDRLSSDAELDKPRTIRKLSELHEYLGSTDEAIRLAKEATRLAPTDFDTRLRLGRLLVGEERFQEAQTELRWCVRRQPDHEAVKKLLAAANRESLLRQADGNARLPSSSRLRK